MDLRKKYVHWYSGGRLWYRLLPFPPFSNNYPSLRVLSGMCYLGMDTLLNFSQRDMHRVMYTISISHLLGNKSACLLFKFSFPPYTEPVRLYLLFMAYKHISHSSCSSYNLAFPMFAGFCVYTSSIWFETCDYPDQWSMVKVMEYKFWA